MVRPSCRLRLILIIANWLQAVCSITSPFTSPPPRLPRSEVCRYVTLIWSLAIFLASMLLVRETRGRILVLGRSPQKLHLVEDQIGYCRALVRTGIRLVGVG